ncbi:NB-ARC domain-containing protein [Amycolatopsis sp. NPDC049688]|uniref:NB-ARC domain-containing protein n=1 Tax=Amycolatopsis sp. NPDC049688 TaxID=3154733 RepID=UPI0034381B8F
MKLVVAALVAGAATGAQETASTAVKNAHAGVKSLAVRVLRRAESVPVEVVELVESDAMTLAGDESGTAGHRELTAALAAAGAGADEELVAAALKVLELIYPDGTHAGKYQVWLHGNQSVQVGDHNTQINYNTVIPAPLPAIESVPALPNFSRIPLDTALFVGRIDELDQLEEVLSGSGRAAVVVVHGLGGVGKSTLAARFAHQHADRFGLRWWITADSRAALDMGLAELAETLQPATADLPVEQRSALGVRWIATHDDWLLVLDNVTTPQDVAGLLSRVRTGTIVITSRQRSGWRAAETVPLDVLAEDEAMALLARIVRPEWPDADLAGADRLCGELGWLPLAVEQAGAYLAQTRTSPAAYLNLLARFPARMFTATAEGGDAQRTMARIWHVTLDRLADTRPRDGCCGLWLGSPRTASPGTCSPAQ